MTTATQTPTTTDLSHLPHATRAQRDNSHASIASGHGRWVLVALRNAAEHARLGLSNVFLFDHAAAHARNAWRHAQHIGSCLPCADGGCAA